MRSPLTTRTPSPQVTPAVAVRMIPSSSESEDVSLVLEVEIGEVAAAVEGQAQKRLHLGHGHVARSARALVSHATWFRPASFAR